MGKFNREKDQRKALIRGLVSDLFRNTEISTTTERCKDIRPVAEKLITKARKGGEHNYRLVLAALGNNTEVADLLFNIIAPQLKRESGYLAITPGDNRRGDNAKTSSIGFVDEINLEMGDK